ncbi:MAG: ABC transporter permease [Methylocystaceae bacterium]|nr:ABC transporter permease [Methylocystaceae bacterium]
MKPARLIVHNPSAPLAKPVEQKLDWKIQLWQNSFIRKCVILIALIILWEGYGRWLDNALLFPTFSDTIEALKDRILDGSLLNRTRTSLQILIMGYVIGVALAGILTVIAINTQIGSDFLETMTAMFSPLPAIALLPLALIWFGLGQGSLVFILIHSVLWPVALNTHSGFRSVSPTLRMVGRNVGLRGFSYIFKILIPAAFASILTGMKIGWAFAWRTLVAAELVFGVSSGKGGLGWFIFENRNLLEIPNVFAGLLTVILIGLFVENLVFRSVEKRTVLRWGLQN